MRNDPRVTGIGKILRRTSIDELPQLFNILKGDMSLVGPRPERPQFVEKFKGRDPEIYGKHQVRPGLTGWAQVNGLRGDSSIKKRIEYDIYYIENWTLGFDIKIILMTFFTGFINKKCLLTQGRRQDGNKFLTTMAAMVRDQPEAEEDLPEMDRDPVGQRPAGQRPAGNGQRTTSGNGQKRVSAKQRAAKKRRKVIIFGVEIAVILIMVAVLYLVMTHTNNEGPKVRY